MSFRALIQNRLRTEEAVLTQTQLNLLLDYLNCDPPIGIDRIGDVVLAQLEQAGMSPFPHDCPMDSVSACIEDLAVWLLNGEQERWLSDTLQKCMATKSGAQAQGVYNTIRSHLDDTEFRQFDLATKVEMQVNFLLLCAHAVKDEL